MTKGDVRPLMMSVEHSVRYMLTCINKKFVRYSEPRIVDLLI